MTIKQQNLEAALHPESRTPSPEPMTHVKEQAALRDETIAAFHTAVAGADSDDDLPPSDPIPYKKANGRSKKPRMSAVFSDVEEDEEAAEMNSFAKRLTKYQKSPSKSKSKG